MGMILEAEQVETIGAQLDDLGDDRVGVIGIAIVATARTRATFSRSARLLPKLGTGSTRGTRVANGIGSAGRPLALATAAAASFTSCCTPAISASVACVKLPSSASSRELNSAKLVDRSWLNCVSFAFCAGSSLAPLRTTASYSRVSRRIFSGVEAERMRLL